MDRNEVLEKVIAVCKDVFDNEDLVLNEASCAAEVEEWDSLTNLSIISDLEDEFGVCFTLDEINNTPSLGGLADIIVERLSK